MLHYNQESGYKVGAYFSHHQIDIGGSVSSATV